VLCDGKPVMYASVTGCASLTVAESANSGPRFAKWSPFTGVGEDA
jgi:hypothetical protein